MADDIRPIRSQADYEAAVAEINRLFDAEPGTSEFDRLDVLITLVDAYEHAHVPLAEPDPVAAIRFHMDQTGKTQADLARLFGSRSRASEVLNRRRQLTLDMIRRLHKEWGIPLESIIAAEEVTE